MGFFSKIKHHVKNITKSAKQRAQEERERIETVSYTHLTLPTNREV